VRTAGEDEEPSTAGCEERTKSEMTDRQRMDIGYLKDAVNKRLKAVVGINLRKVNEAFTVFA